MRFLMSSSSCHCSLRWVVFSQSFAVMWTMSQTVLVTWWVVFLRELVLYNDCTGDLVSCGSPWVSPLQWLYWWPGKLCFSVSQSFTMTVLVTWCVAFLCESLTGRYRSRLKSWVPAALPSLCHQTDYVMSTLQGNWWNLFSFDWQCTFLFFVLDRHDITITVGWALKLSIYLQSECLSCWLMLK